MQAYHVHSVDQLFEVLSMGTDSKSLVSSGDEFDDCPKLSVKRKQEDATEMSTAQKSKNTLEMSSSAIIATNYFVRKVTKAVGNSGSHKEKKQEGNSSAIICSMPNCSQVFQNSSEYYIHVMNCPPRKPTHKKYVSPFKSVVGDSTVCSVCGKELASAINLQKHLRVFSCRK